MFLSLYNCVCSLERMTYEGLLLCITLYHPLTNYLGVKVEYATVIFVPLCIICARIIFENMRGFLHYQIYEIGVPYLISRRMPPVW